MSNSPSSATEVGVAATRRQAEVLKLVFSRLPLNDRLNHVARLVATARRGQQDLSGLFEARPDGRLLAAAWIEPQTPLVATLWGPRWKDGAPCEWADALLDAADRWIVARDVTLAQTLLEASALDELSRLEAHGYQRLADLSYMVWLTQELPSEPPDAELEFQSLADLPQPIADERLGALVARTYFDTLDCPALGHDRPAADVLAEYRRSGAYEPARWHFVRSSGEDVGCLLLNQHASPMQWELTYMGLVPEARGRGWGARIVRFAQRLAHARQCPRIVLAVDAANAPATMMYERAGFLVWDRRTALIKRYTAVR